MPPVEYYLGDKNAKPEICLMCNRFLSEDAAENFKKRQEEEQEYQLKKFEIVFGKDRADNLREKVKQGQFVSIHLGPYNDLSLEELEKVFKK